MELDEVALSHINHSLYFKRGSPRMNKITFHHFSILQATESWVGPKNKTSTKLGGGWGQDYHKAGWGLGQDYHKAGWGLGSRLPQSWVGAGVKDKAGRWRTRICGLIQSYFGSEPNTRKVLLIAA